MCIQVNTHTHTYISSLRGEQQPRFQNLLQKAELTGLPAPSINTMQTKQIILQSERRRFYSVQKEHKKHVTADHGWSLYRVNKTMCPSHDDGPSTRHTGHTRTEQDNRKRAPKASRESTTGKHTRCKLKERHIAREARAADKGRERHRHTRPRKVQEEGHTAADTRRERHSHACPLQAHTHTHTRHRAPQSATSA